MGIDTKATALSKISKFVYRYWDSTKKALVEPQLTSIVVEVSLYDSKGDFIKDVKPKAVVTKGFESQNACLRYLRKLNLANKIETINEDSVIEFKMLDTEFLALFEKNIKEPKRLPAGFKG